MHQERLNKHSSGKGKRPEEKREHGVGFAIRNALLCSITPPSNGSERVLKLSCRLPWAWSPFLMSMPQSCTQPQKRKIGSMKTWKLPRLMSLSNTYFKSFVISMLGLAMTLPSWPVCLGQYGFGKLNGKDRDCCSFALHTTSVLPTLSFVSSPFTIYLGGTVGLSIGISSIFCYWDTEVLET